MTNIELQKLIEALSDVVAEQKESIYQQGMAIDLCFARIDALENPAAAAEPEPAADADPTAEVQGFKVGDKVRVTAGDWGNSQGVITEVDERKEGDEHDLIHVLLINGWQEAYVLESLLELVEAA